MHLHGFTGCDVASAFRGRGKKSAWQTWDVFDKVTETFMFASKQRLYDFIPPTQTALRGHAERAAFQTGVIWGQATCADPDIGNPADWGWMKTVQMWKVCWTQLPPSRQAARN